MAIPFTCSCKAQYRLKDQLAGKKTKCPACGRIIEVPSATASTPTVSGAIPVLPPGPLPPMNVPPNPTTPTGNGDPFDFYPKEEAVRQVPSQRRRRYKPPGKTWVKYAVLLSVLIGFIGVSGGLFVKFGLFGTPSEVEVVTWYSGTSIGGSENDHFTPRLSLKEESLRKGLCFLVVEARLQPHLLNISRSKPDKVDIQLSYFNVLMPDGTDYQAEGSRPIAIGTGSFKLNMFQPGIQVIGTDPKKGGWSKPVDVGVYFVVPRDPVEAGEVMFQFKNRLPIPLAKE